MSKLFGIPTASLAVVLVALLAVAVGAIAALAVRNRVFLRLGLRNAGRRRGRSALIVTGLMLGTAIIATALATGDTMSHTIRSSAISALGPADEVVAARGVDAALAFDRGGATSVRYFPQGYADRIARAAVPSGLVAGAEPVIMEPVAVQDVSTRQNEPAVTLFASDPARMRPFGPIRTEAGVVSVADLRPGEVYLNAKAADELGAHAGDTIRILTGRIVGPERVRAVVRYEGGATDGSGLLMPLGAAQRLLGKPGLIRAVFVSNRHGVSDTDRVIDRLRPTLAPLGLEADNTKQDALDTADKAGASFMSIFTTFGSFSIAAGILLVFLIFVMLAAERRGELGIARAVGTRRGHLVQMFLYEGVAYDLVAALLGVIIGSAMAYGMVRALAGVFSTSADFHISYSVSGTSIVLAYAIGVLLTLAVVAFSAWRVSRMNIVTAIRNLPEPDAGKVHRRRWLLGVAGVVAGLLLAVSGVSSKDEIVLGLGISLVILSLVPIARVLGASDRAAHTAAGLALVGWFALPVSRWLFGEMKVNFSIFILGGLMIVIGATWAIMYNADVLLGALAASLGRIRGLAPVLKMSIAYPLRSLFRTGVTLAMFTLVVFTLVTGAITTGSFVNGFDNLALFGGGFDVRATTSPASPIVHMRTALARAPGLNPDDFRVVSAQSVLPVKARQLGVGAKPESYLVHGVDNTFLEHTTYKFGAVARGYGSPAAVWRALRERPGLAVVDSLVVPRKANWNLAPTSKFRLRGFYLEDKTFAPIPVDVRDPQTGRHERLTVIGVLGDATPQFMAGLWTSQGTLSRTFGDRVLPTVHLLALRKGVDPKATAKKLESAFLANGMQADSLQKLLDDTVSANLTFDRLIEGFMGLGLIVGVAALGVITARSVVERRQQIGVLRAIGFRRRMVQLAFLLESSFVALTSIVVGTALGLVVAFNVVHDATKQPGLESVTFDVPWGSLGLIFGLVYLVALATTLAPAVRASRIYPAEALRYQ
jgi:putative ABC transport system permease protein